MCNILHGSHFDKKKKKFKKKPTDIILKVAEGINFLIMSWFFLF